MKLKTVSNSSLSTYDSCPLKYHYSYVRGIWPERVPKALAIGGAVHKVLAELYRKKITNQELDLTEASTIFLKSLKKKPIDLVDTTEDIITLEYQNILKKIILNPLDIKPKFVERFFEVDFVSPVDGEKLEPRLRGIIDLIAEEDTIVEHKTSSKKYRSEDILKSFQHVGYDVGYYNLFGKRPKKILYDVIYKIINNPLIDVFEVNVSDRDIKKYFKWARKIIKGIEEEKWPAKPEYLKCRFCNYSQICPNSKF